MRKIALKIAILIIFSSCARLFGWEIHAPGILSQNFFFQVPQPAPHRVALYFEPETWNYISKARGGKLADPTTFHVGESYVPMTLEGFQAAFEEFIFMEIEPTGEILKRYGVEYLVILRIKGVQNRMTMKGQAVQLDTEAVVYTKGQEKLAHFESTGSSDAEKIFAKKGGPEVNLNAAIENNVIATIQYLQDGMRAGKWQQ